MIETLTSGSRSPISWTGSGLHAETHAVHATRKEIARKIAACRKKTPRKITACSLRFDPETGCLADPEGKNGSQRNWTGMTRAASDVGDSYADEFEKAGNGTLPN